MITAIDLKWNIHNGAYNEIVYKHEVKLSHLKMDRLLLFYMNNNNFFKEYKDDIIKAYVFNCRFLKLFEEDITEIRKLRNLEY